MYRSREREYRIRDSCQLGLRQSVLALFRGACAFATESVPAIEVKQEANQILAYLSTTPKTWGKAVLRLHEN